MLALLSAFLLVLQQANAVPHSRAQAVSNDGKLFAYSLDDGTLHIVSLPEGKRLRDLTGYLSPVEDLSFNLAGTLCASVAEDGSLTTFNPTGTEAPTRIGAGSKLIAWQGRTRSIDFVDSERKLFIAGGTERLRLFDRSTGSSVREWTIGDESPSRALSPITASTVSFDGKHVACGDDLGRFAVYSALTGLLEFGPWQVPPRVNSLAFDMEAHRLAVGGGDCKARVVTLDEKHEMLELSHCDEDLGGDLAIGAVRFSSDSKQLLTTSFTWWEVRLWDVQSGNGIWRFEFEAGNPIPLVAKFANDSTVVITSQRPNQLAWGTVLDRQSGKSLRALGESIGGGSFVYSEGGEYAWIGSSSKITIIEPRTAKIVCEIPLVKTSPR